MTLSCSRKVETETVLEGLTLEIKIGKTQCMRVDRRFFKGFLSCVAGDHYV